MVPLMVRGVAQLTVTITTELAGATPEPLVTVHIAPDGELQKCGSSG